MSDYIVKRLREGATWDDDIAAANLIEELEANINLKADFIDATMNQLAASEQRISELVKERDGYFAERNKFKLYLQRTKADLELEVAAVDALNAKLEALDYAYDSLVQALQFEGLRTDEAESKLAKAIEALEYYADTDCKVLAELKGQVDE